MARVVVKFRDDNGISLEADGFYQEGGFLTVYKRNDAHEAVKRGMCYEIVGRFQEQYIASIWVKEETAK